MHTLQTRRHNRSAASRSPMQALMRAGLLGGLLASTTLLGGCHLWSGGKMTAEERASVMPGKVLEFETQQRGTVVKLSNAGEAPLTITYPPESGKSWTLGPGDTWRRRLRTNKIVEIANLGTEPTKLGVFTKARNFAFEFDLREKGSAGDPTRLSPP